MLPNHLLTCWVKGYEHAAGWRYAGWLKKEWREIIIAVGGLCVIIM